jgi:CDP-diacylglycerol--serine O-phosphatidyltransferase
MKALIKHIPNTITLLNLLAGCFAILSAFFAEFQMALIFILIAAVFDFLDGLAARLLNAYSPMGKELDSLSDMVSFGVAPGFIVFSLLLQNNAPLYLLPTAFFIPLFSALRLAKFNIDSRQTENFLGLATPANAVFWGSFATLPLYMFFNHSQTITLTISLLVLFCLLMISELPMFSLKFRNLVWRENTVRYIFIALSIALLVIFRTNGLAAIILLYILLSLVVFLTRKQSQEQQ